MSTQSFLTNPRKLMMVDGVGAIFSAFMLGIVLVRFESFFGIPYGVLYLLTGPPVLFALYDFLVIRFAKNLNLYLKIIAILNGAYCLLSMVMAWQHQSTLTIFGWLYLIGEVLVVLVLSRQEWIVGSKS